MGILPIFFKQFVCFFLSIKFAKEYVKNLYLLFVVDLFITSVVLPVALRFHSPQVLSGHNFQFLSFQFRFSTCYRNAFFIPQLKLWRWSQKSLNHSTKSICFGSEYGALYLYFLSYPHQHFVVKVNSSLKCQSIKN